MKVVYVILYPLFLNYYYYLYYWRYFSEEIWTFNLSIVKSTSILYWFM